MVGGPECHWCCKGFCTCTRKIDPLVTGGLSWSTQLSSITLTCSNQVSGDHQLLHTARDYFHFVTNFHELINVSATHIYHSALELSPLSSVVRKVYYHQRSPTSPKVAIGASDLWQPSTAVSSKNSRYFSSTWSLCGQFVAVVAEAAVEVWDALTLKLLSTMQLPTVATRFKQGIAYSPDRHCLAGCSGDAIIIWDTQTGGVVKEIKSGDIHNCLELMWSLDGKRIGAVSQKEWTTYNFTLYLVVSGTALFSGTLQSWGGLQLWPYGENFQIATTTEGPEGCVMDIFEAGVTFIKTKSHSLQCDFRPGPFSPTAYRIYLSASQGQNSEFVILDVHTSRTLLKAKGSYKHPCFSPDGNLFAASTKDYLSIWRYTSSGYALWRKIQQSSIQPQFSPTLSSIFGYAGAALYILHLGYSPAALITEPIMIAQGQPLDAFSPNGTFIATTYYQQSTITITCLNSSSPSPSQFIDTDLKISEIALTGNVLLVNSSETIVGWLLTEEGVVDGILGNSRADQNDSLWTVSPQNLHPALLARLQQQQHGKYLEFAVSDEVAAIKYTGIVIHAYHIRTGEIVGAANAPPYPVQSWYRFNNPLNRSDCDLYHHQCNELHKPNWPVSQTTLQEGWVKDPEGKHRLWLSSHWGSAGDEADWLNEVSTLRLRNSSELVVIKF